MNVKKWIAVAAVSVMAVTALVGCGSEQSKVLRVGSETTFAPFEFVDHDKYVGFDVELADALAKEMGYEKSEIVSMGFDALIPALQSKNVDMIAAGMVITPERQEKVFFSEPYYDSGLVIVVRKDDNTIHDVPDLAGKQLGAQLGTTGSFFAKEQPNATVKEMDTINQLFLELGNKGVDAVILDKPVAQYWMNQGASKDFKIVGPMVKANKLGLAVRKDDKQMQEKLTKALQTLRENGVYDKLYEKWFGEKPAK